MEFLTRVIAMFNSRPNINKMGFLSSFFKIQPDSFTDADDIEIDIVRSGEQVAPVVRSLDTGAIVVKQDYYTNKKVKFPVYALKTPVGIAELMKKQPGESAYVTAKVNWLGRLAAKLVQAFADHTTMMRYAMELQASQVLQTGTITLTDENGESVYILDFKPKATHFATVTTAWGTDTANPITDITTMIDVVRDDSMADVTDVIFGDNSWRNFIKNSEVKEYLKSDALALGALNPQIRDKGGKCMGYIDIGASRVFMWTYNGRYSTFGSNSKKRFLDNDKVIFIATADADLRRMFGGIPEAHMDESLKQILPPSVDIGSEYAFRPRVWFDNNTETYLGETKCRPLMDPVAIDTFACLTTKI